MKKLFILICTMVAANCCASFSRSLFRTGMLLRASSLCAAFMMHSVNAHAASQQEEESYYIPWSKCPWTSLSAYKARLALEDRCQYELRMKPNLQLITLLSLIGSTKSTLIVPQEAPARAARIPFEIDNELCLSHVHNKINLEERKPLKEEPWLKVLLTPEPRFTCSGRCTFTKIRDKGGKSGFSIAGVKPEQYVEIFTDKQGPKEVRIMEANIASIQTTASKEGYLLAELEEGACKSLIIHKNN